MSNDNGYVNITCVNMNKYGITDLKDEFQLYPVINRHKRVQDQHIISSFLFFQLNLEIIMIIGM